MRRHLRDREVVGLVILFGPQLSYLPRLMNDRFDAPSYVIGGVLSGAPITSALVSSQLGRLTGRFSEKALLRCAFLIYAAGLAAVAFAPTLPLLLVPFGVAQGINLPNVSSLFNSHAPNEKCGAFMATNGTALRTGQTIGPLLMASLAGTLGATGAYLATAAIALLAFLLALVAVR